MADADYNLVERMRAGDRAAFEEFFNEYHPKLYRFALRRLQSNVPAAQDAAQNTICAALKSLHTYRGEAALFSWLCTICRRQIGSTRGASLQEMREDDPEVQAALEALLTSERGDPVSAASAGEVREAVLTALDYLPDEYATVLEWKYVHEMSVAEISDRTGRTVKATESMLTRARSAFREAFNTLQVPVPTSSSVGSK